MLCLCETCSDQFARAFHRGSRPGSALSGNVPSPIDRSREPQYGNYADEQSHMGRQVMAEGRSLLLSSEHADKLQINIRSRYIYFGW